ncbi:MAG UNVERIFIED_CONTAM: hypothetical protein LVT10_23205 [Anaerolineae bacterium]
MRHGQATFLPPSDTICVQTTPSDARRALGQRQNYRELLTVEPMTGREIVEAGD